MIRLMKLPDKPSIPGLRPMERKDCTKAWKLLSEYLKVRFLTFTIDFNQQYRNLTWHQSTLKMNLSTGFCPVKVLSTVMWLKMPMVILLILAHTTPCRLQVKL